VLMGGGAVLLNQEPAPVTAGRPSTMTRSLLAAIAFGLLLFVGACNGGSNENAFSRRPTFTAVPTPTPLDPNLGCGPPLSEFECAETYRPPPASCHVSDVWRKPNVGYGIGRPPVWMARSPVGGVLPPERRPTPVTGERTGAKTIWIVEVGVEGEVKLTGRRLDGPEVAVFPLYERDHTFELNADGTRKRDWDRTELVLIPPHGGDHRTEVYFPSPGCWQFTARTETETVEIVLYLYPLETP